MLKTQLASRQIDLAFLLGPMEEPRIENLYLCNYPLSWVASPKLDVYKRQEINSVQSSGVSACSTGRAGGRMKGGPGSGRRCRPRRSRSAR